MATNWTAESRDTLADKFHACDPKVLEWAEGFAIAAVKEQADIGQVIAQQMSSTLTWLLGAAFGAAAYSANLMEAPGVATPTAWTVAFTGAYLLLLCAIVVIEGMSFRPTTAAYNVPSHLLHQGFDLDAHRPGELVLLEERIEALRSLNESRARLLNQVRAAAVFAPLILLLVRPMVDIMLR